MATPVKILNKKRSVQVNASPTSTRLVESLL
jgi:hypothetical protein